MKHKIAVITVELVDESIESSNETIKRELAECFYLNANGIFNDQDEIVTSLELKEALIISRAPSLMDELLLNKSFCLVDKSNIAIVTCRSRRVAMVLLSAQCAEEPPLRVDMVLSQREKPTVAEALQYAIALARR